jgi:RimJ/RimL family protein N-acetyltransferase
MAKEVAMERQAITLLPWTEAGLDLLRALNTPTQKAHLGGPETEAKLLDRQRRYMESNASGGETRMFRIGLAGEAVGAIGYWERQWQGQTVYETGWEIRPGFHGRGIAGAAGRLLLAQLGGEARHRHVHAYPAPDNAPSNAICRKLGFVLLGPCEVEFPKGHLTGANDWRFDLEAERPA